MLRDIAIGARPWPVAEHHTPFWRVRRFWTERHTAWEIVVAALLYAVVAVGQFVGLRDLVAAHAAPNASAHTSASHVHRYAPYEPPRAVQRDATEGHPAYTVYATGDTAEPRPALIVLHGMGGNGPQMANLVLPFAQAQGWVVIAPTIAYGDWRDPEQVATEDLRLAPQLAGLLDTVPAETGEVVSGRAMVFGFSRGAQAALRLSLLFPERVQAVAALSAGTYTLPVATVKTVVGQTLDAPMPYGVADLARRIGHELDGQALAGVRFLVGVGEADNSEADVPHQWDAYVGKSRLERANRFGALLSQLGYQAQVAVIPGAGHEVNGAMLERVTSFLAQCAPQSLQDATMTAPALPELPPAISISLAKRHTQDDLRGL